MSCPQLKEVVMLFCQAYPVKKMVPLDRLASANPCLSGDFEHCPLYQDLLKKAESCGGLHDDAPMTRRSPFRKEVQR